MYELSGLDIDFFLMSRPWLSADDFNIEMSGLTDIFNEQIEKELSSLSEYSDKTYLKNQPFDKANKLRNYAYKNIYMDSYGEPIYDTVNQTNKSLKYKINDNEFASVVTYFNKDNLLCNNVTIRDLSEINKPVWNFNLITWLDIKTEFGFIREFNKNKYYYDNNNNLINVETPYNYSSFPPQKKKN